MSVPVLMYHAIGETGTGTQQYDDADFTVSEKRFCSHLDYLSQHSFSSLLPSELKYLNFGAAASDNNCVITFDDGHASDAALALPILLSRGFKAVFFITTEWIGKPGYMNESEIKAISDAGMELGSHGHTHAFFNDLSYQQALSELQQSCDILKSISGKETVSFSAPGGQLPARLQDLSEAVGIEYVFTSSTGLCNAGNFPFAIPRCAIRRDLSDTDFARIVNCDASLYRRIRVRSNVLGAVRRMLGNDRYMALRERLL